MEIVSFRGHGGTNPYSGIVESALKNGGCHTRQNSSGSIAAYIVESALKNGGCHSGEGFTVAASGGKYLIDFGTNGTEEGTYLRKYWAVIGESESQFVPFESVVHKCDTAFQAVSHYHAQKEAVEWAAANNHTLNRRLSAFDWGNREETERKRKEETAIYLEGRDAYLYCYNHFDAHSVLVVKPKYKFIEIREIWLPE